MENKTMSEPKSLQQAIVYFANPDNCLRYLVARRWPKGVVCPTCGSENVSFSESRRIWQCSTHHAKRQFSVKVGTIFEDSPIGLDKWLAAIWMLTNCKNGISSYEVARDLGVTQKSAWFMMHRIRLAMRSESLGKKLGGKRKEIEVDETFVGGAAKFMHKAKRERLQIDTSKKEKTPVFGILERGGEVRAMVIANRRKPLLQAEIAKNVEKESFLASDALMSYHGLNAYYTHEAIDHAYGYVRGRVHTNGLENFWSLLKRSIKGTYVSVEPFHLSRYLDEQVYRYNNRKNPMNDSRRFSQAVSRIVGKRLTWNVLTGKTADPQTCLN
jgi:transposase-like protein